MGLFTYDKSTGRLNDGLTSWISQPRYRALNDQRVEIAGGTNRRNTAKTSVDRNTRITLTLTVAGCNLVVYKGFTELAQYVTIGRGNL